MKLIDAEIEIGFLSNIVFLLGNASKKNHPPPKIEVVEKVLPTLIQLIHHSDTYIMLEIIWVVVFLTDSCDEQIISLILKSKIFKHLVFLLSDEKNKILEEEYNQEYDPSQEYNLTRRIQTAALRVIGNVMMGTDEKEAQEILEGGVLTHFKGLLELPLKKMKKSEIFQLPFGPTEEEDDDSSTDEEDG